MSLRAFLI